MNNKDKRVNSRLLLFLTLISVGLFMYEVILSRLFSVLLSYHYVFFIISLAMLGMGLGSFMEYKNRRGKRKTVDDKIIKFSVQLTLTMFFSFWLIYLLPFTSTIIYILISVVPYIYAGRLLTTVFSEYGEHSNKIYFVDLIGAGLAAIGSIVLLFSLGFISTVHVLFIIIFSSIFLIKRFKVYRKTQIAFAILIAVQLVGVFSTNVESWLKKNFNSYLSSPSTSLSRLRDGNLDYDILYTEWDGFARTDVVTFGENDTRRIVTINGSANASMLKWDGTEESVSYLKKDPGFLPYLMGEVYDVAIIGAGGGKDVVQALIGGAKNIDAIEINQSAINAVKSMGDYNGFIYDQPEVNVIVGEGRSILANSDKKYDIIFASLVMTGTSEAGYAMAESYIYTEEAFDIYYDLLKPNGKLVFIAHDSSDMYKIINTAYKTLQSNDVSTESIKDHMIVGIESVFHGEVEMMHSPLVVVKKDNVFNQDEISITTEFFENNTILPFHLGDLNENSYVSFLSNEDVTLQDVYRGTEMNIVPATDNSPYFYNFNKGISDVFIAIIGIISMILIIFIIYIKKERAMKPSIHFSLLGIVFMLVEVGLIQILTLYLEHPTLAFTVTVASLLIGAGIGSYFSNCKFWFTKKERHRGALGIALSLSLTLLLLWNFKNEFLSSDIWIKSIISFIISVGNGFFMGMLFPYSIQKVKRMGKQNLIPLLYGVNGIFSVLGSVLAIILSMQFGINFTLISGVMIYLTIFIFMPQFFKN